MMRTAAENWRQHGNILGTNEIMGLMFHRDLLMLGLSDGIMCGATGFGLVLQKIIAGGNISWDKQGWIIQSVSPARYKDSHTLGEYLLVSRPLHSLNSANNDCFRYGKHFICLEFCIGLFFANGRGLIRSSLCCMV